MRKPDKFEIANPYWPSVVINAQTFSVGGEAFGQFNAVDTVDDDDDEV